MQWEVILINAKWLKALKCMQFKEHKSKWFLSLTPDKSLVPKLVSELVSFCESDDPTIDVIFVS